MLAKVEQVDTSIQEEEERWAAELQELNEARRSHLQALQTQLMDSLKSTRNVLRSVDEVCRATGRTGSSDRPMYARTHASGARWPGPGRGPDAQGIDACHARALLRGPAWSRSRFLSVLYTHTQRHRYNEGRKDRLGERRHGSRQSASPTRSRRASHRGRATRGRGAGGQRRAGMY
jgi:DNA-binding protein H-NS